MVLEAGQSKIQVPTDLVLGEGPLPGCRWSCSHSSLTRQTEEALVSPPLLIRPLIPSLGLHPQDSSKSNQLPKAYPPNTITLGVRAPTYKCGVGGTQTFSL